MDTTMDTSPSKVSPLLTTVLETSRDALAVLDARRFLVDANQALVDLVGYGREEIYGLHFRTLFNGSGSVLSFVARHSVNWSGSATITCGNGSTVPALLSLTPALDAQGTIVGLIVRLRRRVDGKTAGDAMVHPPGRQFERLKHRLRDVLTTIVLNLELVDKEVVDSTHKIRFTLVQKAAASGIELLERAPSECDS